MDTYTYLSICTGVAGLDLGLELALGTGIPVCYVEREIEAAEVLVARMEDGSIPPAPIWSDLTTFDATPFRGMVDVVVGGYPCQPFSVAGKRKGDEDERYIWDEVARIVRECEPTVCFFENVANHLNLGFHKVARDLQEMGYRVAAVLLTAEEVDASHKRERLFIMAHSLRVSRERWGVYRELEETTTEEYIEAYQRERDGNTVDDSFDSMGNSPSPRLERRQLGSGREVWDKTWREESSGRRSEMGDTDRDELERPSVGGDGDRNRYSESTEFYYPSDRLPVFAPGPDYYGWGDLLVWYPELRPALSQAEIESTLCGMADGITNRVDRLKACGNGVVPLQFACAIRILLENLEID